MALKRVFDYRQVFDNIYYPAGEPQVRLIPGIVDDIKDHWDHPFIVVKARDWNELMAITIGNEVLRYNGIAATFVIPYLPFARHDRRNDANDSNPVPWVLQLLSTVDAVTIDPHSDVSGVLPHYHQARVVALFEKHAIFENNALVAIPDAGATKKAYAWLGQRDYVQCLKTRDTKTGALSGFEIIHPEMVYDRDVVIIDDICDGGGTFIGLAEKLLEANARSLRLGVTHGLFTKGIEVIKKKFDRIYTLDCGSYSSFNKLNGSYVSDDKIGRAHV